MTHSFTVGKYDDCRRELVESPCTWLITGAAGFIGSNLVQELLLLGQHVIGFDNFATGFQANLADAVTASEGTGGSFQFFEGDIRDATAVSEAMTGVRYVLHHAAVASVPASIDDPVYCSAVNQEGFLNVLVAARDAGVSRVVYASSSAVYGDVVDVPQFESSTGNALSPYAATKAANELYANVFQRTYGLEVVGLRYFNVFGRRQDPNGAYAAVIPRWVANLLSGAACELYGDGGTSRDFCYVANVVQANLLAATTTNTGATSQAYNVACGEETTLSELFELIRAGLSEYEPSIAEARPVFLSERKGDIRRSVADIGKARRLLGFEPAYGTADGLREALSWYAGQMNEGTRSFSKVVANG